MKRAKLQMSTTTSETTATVLEWATLRVEHHAGDFAVLYGGNDITSASRTHELKISYMPEDGSRQHFLLEAGSAHLDEISPKQLRDLATALLTAADSVDELSDLLLPRLVRPIGTVTLRRA